jgi:hypothetical protein
MLSAAVLPGLCRSGGCDRAHTPCGAGSDLQLPWAVLHEAWQCGNAVGICDCCAGGGHTRRWVGDLQER